MDSPLELRDAVEAAAERLGAKRFAVLKWRQRGIPADWKLKLITDPDTSFSFDDLDRVCAVPVAHRASRKREQSANP